MTRLSLGLIALSVFLSCAPTALIRLGNSTVTVELDATGGDQNPTWTLTGNEVDELSRFLENPPPAEGVTFLPAADSDYRGFRITAANRAFEEPPRAYLVRDGYIQVLVAAGEAGRIFRDVRGAEDWLIENARGRGYGTMIP
ncbi:MAG: hypothetical protein GEU90_07020 [Gemmatimonas sp.]|nr:hypothetical protein [Gemmatimonas sp.]